MYKYGTNIFIKNIPLVPTGTKEPPKTIWETIKNYVFPLLRLAIGVVVDVLGDLIAPFSLGASLAIKLGINTIADGIFNLIETGKFYISYWSFLNVAGAGFLRWIGSFKQFSKAAKFVKNAKKLFNDGRNLIFNTANFLKGELIKNGKKLGTNLLAKTGVKNATKLSNNLIKLGQISSRVSSAVISGENVEKKLFDIAYTNSLQKISKISKSAVKKQVEKFKSKNPLYVNEVKRLNDDPKTVFISSSWLSHITFLNNLWMEKYALGANQTENFVLHWQPEATNNKQPLLFNNQTSTEAFNLINADSPGRYYLNNMAYGRIAGIYQKNSNKGVLLLTPKSSVINKNYVKVSSLEEFNKVLEERKKFLTPFLRTRGKYKTDNKIGIIYTDDKGNTYAKYTSKLSTIRKLKEKTLMENLKFPDRAIYIRRK